MADFIFCMKFQRHKADGHYDARGILDFSFANYNVVSEA